MSASQKGLFEDEPSRFAEAHDTKTKTDSVLSWFGSDSEVSEEIASRFDGCTHVTIPFFGGGAVAKYLSARVIVANDIHADAINFYRVLCSEGEESLTLIARCKHTLSHPGEINEAENTIKDVAGGLYVSPIKRAWAYWALCWLGRKGKGGTKHVGGEVSVRRTGSGGGNASRIVAAAYDLHAWAEIMKRCEWESRDFREVLADVKDREDCGLYVDAPWYKAGRNYLHPFMEKDHRDLHGGLSRFDKTRILIRYDDCEFIRELYSGDKWAIEDRQTRNQGSNESGGKTSEIWITHRGDC